MGRHRGQRREPAPQPGGHRLQHRQAVPGRRARRDKRPGHRVRQRQQPRQRLAQHAARPANRDRHDHAVNAGTCHRPPPGEATHGRAAARAAAAAAAASISAAMITAAPYRRRDHRSAGSSTCVRPQPRHRDRRGQNSAQAGEHRHHPPPRPAPPGQHPAAARPPSAGPPPAGPRHFPPNLVPSSPWCHLRHLPGGLPPSPCKKITGRAAAITDIATVTPSTTPRIPNPPDHTETTPSTAPAPTPMATLNGGGRRPRAVPARAGAPRASVQLHNTRGQARHAGR